MAPLFQPDDVIGDQVEHGVFAGSSEGLARDLTSFLDARHTSKFMFFVCLFVCFDCG